MSPVFATRWISSWTDPPALGLVLTPDFSTEKAREYGLWNQVDQFMNWSTCFGVRAKYHFRVWIESNRQSKTCDSLSLWLSCHLAFGPHAAVAPAATDYSKLWSPHVFVEIVLLWVNLKRVHLQGDGNQYKSTWFLRKSGQIIFQQPRHR